MTIEQERQKYNKRRCIVCGKPCWGLYDKKECEVKDRQATELAIENEVKKNETKKKSIF